MALTPSEVHSERRWADRGPADTEDRQIGVALQQDLVVHTAADACLLASQQHRVMTMTTMEQALYTHRKKNSTIAIQIQVFFHSVCITIQIRPFLARNGDQLGMN